jgi:hypothetical protein
MWGRVHSTESIVFGAAAAGGAAFVLRHLARKAHEIHEHCREMMRDH